MYLRRYCTHSCTVSGAPQRERAWHTRTDTKVVENRIVYSREKIPRTKRRLAAFRFVWWIVWWNFCNVVFLITSPKIIAGAKNWAVSTRLDIRYNMLWKLGSLKYCFDENMTILVFIRKVENLCYTICICPGARCDGTSVRPARYRDIPTSSDTRK